MAAMHADRHGDGMKSSTIVLSAILVAFVAWSVWLVGYDYVGFIDLARREPWGAQVVVDLVIACAIGTAWMVRDARPRGINTIPYVIATVVAGSMGLLAYLIHRSIKAPARGVRSAIGAPSAA